MTTIVEHVRKSLFIRVLAIFGVTVVLFIVNSFDSLQTISDESDAIETIPDYFTRNIESIMPDIGTPPKLANAMRLAGELDWTIDIDIRIINY